MPGNTVESGDLPAPQERVGRFGPTPAHSVSVWSKCSVSLHREPAGTWTALSSVSSARFEVVSKAGLNPRR